MKIVRGSVLSVAVVGILLVGAGCSMEAPQDEQASNDDVSVDVVTDGVDTRQVVTVNGTTMDALTPEVNTNTGRRTADIRAGAVFSGAPARMGVCLLAQYGYGDGNEKNCNVASDCLAQTGVNLQWRCTWDNGLGTGQKKCFYVPGALSSWCAGSPANGGSAIGPGTYWTGWKPTSGGRYISQACYNNCAASDPSASSAGTYVSPIFY